MPKHIIFDLTGVIFHVNKFKHFRYLGLLRLLAYVITHQKSPTTRFLDTLWALQKLEPSEDTPMYYKGAPLPHFMSDRMAGSMTSEQAEFIVDRFMQTLTKQHFFASTREAQVMAHIMRMITKPKQGILALEPDKHMVALLKQLKSNNYKLYALSNLDKESYATVLNNYPEILALFDDIIISAHVGMVKPSPEIYHHILQRCNLERVESLFIDDQQENILAAMALEIPSLHFTGRQQLLKDLKIYGINF
jgi:HAD superfamily hydrolase (TIGR01509 family)